MPPTPSAALLALPLLLLACADDSSGPREVDRNKRLARLTIQESLLLCDRFNELTVGDPAYVQASCVVYGLFELRANTGVSCEDARQECAQQLTEATPCVLNVDRNGKPDSCPDATVGAFSDCMEALAVYNKQRYGDLTCDTPSSEVDELLASAQAPRLNPPEDCQALVRECPEFFADDVSP